MRYLVIGLIAGALLLPHSSFAATDTEASILRDIAKHKVEIKALEKKLDALRDSKKESNIDTKSGPYIGPKKAPVTMMVWFDYQCPFCKNFDEDTVEKLSNTLVEDGDLKIVFRDYQFLGSDSDVVATYGRAVWATYPASWFDWHLKMMALQDDSLNDDFSNLAAIRATTEGMGLDTANIEANLKKNKSKYVKAIKADFAAGQKLGINGTPSFLIGKDGHLYAGSHGFDEVYRLVEEQL